MKVIVCKDYAEMSAKSAEIVADVMKKKPNAVLGLATGSTPIGVYEKLTDWCQEGALDFSKVRTVNLDEYAGLSKEHPQSYCRFMHEHLFDHINIDPENVHIPDGLAEEDVECARYDRLIQSLGGIDLQLLGLGHDGHIGFNEPADAFPLGTHRVALSARTIQANKRFFEDESQVPRFAYTMGIRDIFQAKRVLMIVGGRDKAEILKEALQGPVTPRVPASILQFHKDFTLIADEEALTLF